MSEEFEVQDSEEEIPLHGVRGMLLAYCITLTLFVPFVGAANLVDNFHKASSHFDYVDGLQTFLFINTGLRLVLVIFSMHVGIGLWTLRPHAIRTAKWYLFTFLSVLILAISLLFWYPDWSSSPGYKETIVPIALREVVSSVVFFLGSFFYLSFSKRVKATYMDY